MFRLIFPALAHVLMAAHLQFNGLGNYAALPLCAAMLLAVPHRPIAWLQSFLMVLWGIEWIRADYFLVLRRMMWGEPWYLACAILGGCALFSILSALVFRSDRLKQFYAPN
ncbi:hypothetical protein [Sutterella sp.]|uniref:hypothetical protein n=1 Tax=Sutterella sp. TaxID=1981025 RepID=UPI0026E0B3A5|nr:hypothetical protein [Sutterella sp.]MDO5531201.1 hypothetical protein [Sutterella sp.]